jgi:L-ascorbate metabolism protein UlaG (beta-lactamase superfamily)
LKKISMMARPRLTLIGGPSVLIELGVFRLLTDPTFDAPGEYRLPHVTLQKTAGPSINADKIGPIDTVLLSHISMPTISIHPVANISAESNRF